MAEEKIYCGRGKILPGKNGYADRIKLSFGDKDRAKLEEFKNAKGYTNLIVCQSKEPDKYGNTHYCVIDTWQPSEPQKNDHPIAQQPKPLPVSSDTPAPTEDTPSEEMPF